MRDGEKPAGTVAIVDHGLGNLFSVKHACEHVGLRAHITRDKAELIAADALILPGVGAFGDAMATLHRLDLVSLLRDIASSQTPLLGICLGVQLLMTQSHEFGVHDGLGVFKGSVIRLENTREKGKRLKIPQVGWNGIRRPAHALGDGRDPWVGTLLNSLPEETCMYFVHSYIVKPEEEELVLSTTTYGNIQFCSSLGRANVFACQFHPERSGPTGLTVYENLAARIRARKDTMEAHQA